MVSALSLSLFSDGAHFVAQSSPHSASLRELRVPGVAHNMASMHVVPSRATDSNGRQQRRRRTSQVLGKKSLSQALVKKRQNSPPQAKKNKQSVPNVGHNVVSTRVPPKPAVDCHGRGKRLWPMSPMVVCFCVCVSQSRSYKIVVLHSRSYKSCTNHKTSNKKKVVNMTLCTTMPWWNYPKNTQVFRRGVKIPLCRHTMPLMEIQLRSYFQNNTIVLYSKYISM